MVVNGQQLQIAVQSHSGSLHANFILDVNFMQSPVLWYREDKEASYFCYHYNGATDLA